MNKQIEELKEKKKEIELELEDVVCDVIKSELGDISYENFGITIHGLPDDDGNLTFNAHVKIKI